MLQTQGHMWPMFFQGNKDLLVILLTQIAKDKKDKYIQVWMWMDFVKFRYSEKNTKFQKAVGNFDLSKDVGKSKDLE